MNKQILADTSVWITHFKKELPEFIDILNAGKVILHPFIIGELACGGLQKKQDIFKLIESMPQTVCLEHEEIMSLIEAHEFSNQGIGYVDVHLIGSCLLSDNLLWTYDKALKKVAKKMKLHYL